MRNYPVPPDMREKEKVIGGLFDLTQFFWFLGGFVLGGIIFVFSFTVLRMGKLSIVPGIIGVCSGLPFAFYKKEELTLIEYIRRKKTFDKKTKILENERTNIW